MFSAISSSGPFDSILSLDEERALAELATIQALSMRQTLIQALRVYQLDVMRTKQGCRKVWYDEDGVEMDKPVGCPALD